MHMINGGDVVEQEEGEMEENENKTLEGSGRRKRHNVIKGKDRLWPNGIVPYALSASAKFTDTEYGMIKLLNFKTFKNYLFDWVESNNNCNLRIRSKRHGSVSTHCRT